MSYARRGPDSDVYVFQTRSDLYECNFCALRSEQPGINAHFATALPSVMIEHLLKHRAEGQAVPERAFDALRRVSDGTRNPVALLRELGLCWGRMKHSRPDLVGRLPLKLRALLDQADSYEQLRAAGAPEPEG
jgi:hypothetical protein